MFFRLRLRLRLQNTADSLNPDSLTQPGTKIGGGTTPDEISDLLGKEADTLNSLELEQNPVVGIEFAPLPGQLSQFKNYSTSKTKLKNYIYRAQGITIHKPAALKQYSIPDKPEDDFRIRLMQIARVRCDLEIEKIRKRYSS